MKIESTFCFSNILKKIKINKRWLTNYAGFNSIYKYWLSYPQLERGEEEWKSHDFNNPRLLTK